ncbi:MAG: oxidoreductase, partial [Pirellulales bacterium]|nr:oxidoreductase [Pirellulales bacterium]
IEIAHFLEASSHIQPGPFDLALVEGSISTSADLERIREIRRQSRVLVTIGACATAGGIQALRNWNDHDAFLRHVYAQPQYIDSLATSTPIGAHVAVDFELRGCPVDKQQLLEVVVALTRGRRPRIAQHSVCLDCKRRGIVCVVVTKNQPCLGPVTQSGCGAICPAFNRPCFGCFGPARQANCQSLSDHYLHNGTSAEDLIDAMRNINAGAKLFQVEGDRLEQARGQASAPRPTSS